MDEMKFIYALEDFSRCIIILKVLQDFGAAVLDVGSPLLISAACMLQLVSLCDQTLSVLSDGQGPE